MMAEMKNLRAESFGAIHLDCRFLLSIPISRLYSLLIFCDAARLHSTPNPTYTSHLRSEFTLASSFGAHHADIGFGEFQASSSLSLFDVTSLPPRPSSLDFPWTNRPLGRCPHDLGLFSIKSILPVTADFGKIGNRAATDTINIAGYYWMVGMFLTSLRSNI